MKKVNKEIHTPNSKMTFGDNHGSAIRNKMARSIDISGIDQKYTKVKNPPKSLA